MQKIRNASVITKPGKITIMWYFPASFRNSFCS